MDAETPLHQLSAQKIGCISLWFGELNESNYDLAFFKAILGFVNLIFEIQGELAKITGQPVDDDELGSLTTIRRKIMLAPSNKVIIELAHMSFIKHGNAIQQKDVNYFINLKNQLSGKTVEENFDEEEKAKFNEFSSESFEDGFYDSLGLMFEQGYSELESNNQQELIDKIWAFTRTLLYISVRYKRSSKPK